jgi:NAD(P)H-flavin reductase/ferredoxin
VYKVQAEPFGESFPCDEDESILAAALRAGLFLRYGCKHGGCGTCKVSLVEGDVDVAASSYALSPAEREAGTVLVCQSYPADDCVIDVTAMDLDEEEFHRGDTSGEFTMRVETAHELASDIWQVTLVHEPGTRMPFVAGQFVNVEIPGASGVRSYSMANCPSADDRIELICKYLPGGLFSTFMTRPDVAGEQVRVAGPFGSMAVRLSHRDVVMVAGGSGLAPLLSMLRALARKGSERDITLFFGARSAAELYALDEIGKLLETMRGLTFVPVLAEPHEAWDGATGLVTDAIAAHRPSYSGTDAYLCGPPGMIAAATKILVSRGVREKNISFDAFVPTGDAKVSA